MTADPLTRAKGLHDGAAYARKWLDAGKPIDDLLAAASELAASPQRDRLAYEVAYGAGVKGVLENARKRAA